MLQGVALPGQEGLSQEVKDLDTGGKGGLTQGVY